VGFLFGEDKEKAGKIGDGSDVMEHLGGDRPLSPPLQRLG